MPLFQDPNIHPGPAHTFLAVFSYQTNIPTYLHLFFYASGIPLCPLRPLQKWHYLNSKRWAILSQQHSVTTQKTSIFDYKAYISKKHHNMQVIIP
jgi:hypothetical protein